MEKHSSFVIEYLLIVFVLLWSGGFFTYGLFPQWPIVVPLFAGLFFYKRRYFLVVPEIGYIFLFSLIAAFQTFQFGGAITSIIQPTLIMLMGAFIAHIIYPNFKKIIITVVTFFAAASLVFWVIDLVPVGHSFLLSIARSIPQLGADIYTQNIDSGFHLDNEYTLYFYKVTASFQSDFYNIERNSGPFWEPGRFTIPLTLAIIAILYDDNLLNNYRKSLYILIAADISTLSTTGYVAMVVVVIGYIFTTDKSISKKIVFTVLLAVSIYYLSQLSFIGDKIITASGNTDEANSRFGAMFYHWIQITSSPIIGYGHFLENQISILEISPCGWTDMMRHWGIPFSLISWYLLYKGCQVLIPRKSPKMQLFAWLSIMILAYTQTIMMAPLFIMLYFFSFCKNKYHE